VKEQQEEEEEERGACERESDVAEAEKRELLHPFLRLHHVVAHGNRGLQKHEPTSSSHTSQDGETRGGRGTSGGPAALGRRKKPKTQTHTRRGNV